MAWARRTTKPIPSVSSRVRSYEINDYSKGMNDFVSNDKFPLKDGDSNMWRLAQDARIVTLGEYETRKGLDFHSAAAGETQDQAITATTGAADQSFNELTWKAQRFTTATAGRLSKIDINLKNDAAATGVIMVEIWSDVGSQPGVLLATSSIDGASLTSSYAYYSARFASAPVLAATTNYWIVVYVQSVSSGSYKWSSTTSATTAKTSADSGGAWSTTSYAMNFKQYYSTNSPPKGLARVYKSDGTAVTLFAHGTVLYSVNEVTGALTSVKTGLSASATKYRFVVVNDIVYYVNGFDGLRKWDFTTESQVNANNYTHIIEHKGLLFLVDALDPNKVAFSNFADYEVFTSTDFIYVPSPKTGDPVTALESLNGYLFMFTQGNKYLLYGSDNATFQLEEAPDQKGTFSQETVTVDKNYMYYLSDDGVYRSNGTQADLLSENIYQTVKTITDKDSGCVVVNKGRLYVWYQSASASANDSCFVWNLNYASGSDTIESSDTGGYVSFAVSAYKDDDELIVASSLIGQVYWQELASNDYTNLGDNLNFELKTHYITFESPAVLKEVRYWKPRFSAQSDNYTVDCEYAYDLRDNWQTYNAPNVQGSGYIWGASGTVWGAFTWGSTAEVQADLYVPGEYRRIAIRYKHTATRQPQQFLGHTLLVQTRRLR